MTPPTEGGDVGSSRISTLDTIVDIADQVARATGFSLPYVLTTIAEGLLQRADEIEASGHHPTEVTEP